MNPKPILKTFILMSIFISSSTALFAQVKFEKGYFITKDGARTECLIKNEGARNNPHSFTYELTEEGETKKLEPGDVREVAIEGYARFIGAKVNIDRSSDNAENIGSLSQTRSPKWSEEQLFLRVVTDGRSASLYCYSEPGFIRFFYSTATVPLEQLVYKVYNTEESAFGYNKDYLNQLNVNVNCTNTGSLSGQPDYREGDLKRLFERYNACKGTPVTQQVNNTVKTKRFSVSLMAGGQSASLQAENFLINSITYFDSKISPVGGVELEYTTPFNKNKVSLLLDINNSSYTSSGTDSLGSANITYGSIAVAFGPRYRFFLNDDLALFVDATAILEFRTNSSYQWTSTKSNYLSNGYSLDIRTYTPVFALGAGIAYKDLSAGFRYLSTKEIFPDYPNAGSNFDRMTLILKYRIFKF